MLVVLKRSITCGFAALSVCVLWPSFMVSAADRPNIVLILADDK